MINNKNIPQGWTIAKLEEVCEILDGKRKPINSSERANRINGKLSSELYPYYGATGQVGFIDDYLLDGEFVLLGEDGAPFLEPFKKKAYLVKGKIWVNNHAHILKSYFENQYLNYYLNIVSYREYVTGTTRLKLNQSAMKTIPILLAPLPEQNRILAKLEQLLTGLDKGIEYLETTKHQLKVYRQAVLKWAVEGRLTNKDVKEGELPDKWEPKKISQIAYTFGGYAFKSGDFKAKGQFQVIRMGNVRPGIIRFDESPVFISNIDEKALTKSLLKIDDIIVTQTGTKGKRDYGYTALINKGNLLINQRIAAIRCKSECNPKFLLYYTWTDKFKEQFFANETGNVGQGNVGMKAVTDTLIWIPKPNEQKKVVLEVESRLSVCDKIEETIESSLQQAEALRLSIIKKAFEGKLVPQDPNDEPAEKLLEKIRALRHSSAKLTTRAQGKQENGKSQKKAPLEDYGVAPTELITQINMNNENTSAIVSKKTKSPVGAKN